MISWQNPGWLWALPVLLLPLIIHLLNASSGRRVVFPAIQFASASKARRVRSIALRQPWLLALRWLLLIVLILWLAGPSWRQSLPAAEAAPVLVSPLALQLHPRESRELAAKLAADNDRQPRQLAPGFPALDEPAAYAGPADVMLGSLATDWPAGTRVLVADHPLDRSWQAVPLPEEVIFQSVNPGPPAPLRVGLLAAPGRSADARHVRAALSALATVDRVRWRELGGETSTAEETEPLDVLIALGAEVGQSSPAHRMSLSDSASPRFGAELTLAENRFSIRRAAPAFPGEILLRDDSGAGLLFLDAAGPAPRLQFAGRFHPDSNTLVSSAIFPDLLFEWLSMARLLPQEVAVADVPAPGAWLAALLLACWLAERWLALVRPPTQAGSTANAMAGPHAGATPGVDNVSTRPAELEASADLPGTAA